MKEINHFRAHLICFLTPRTRGVKITIFTIVPKRNAQLSCPFRSSIIYVFGSGLHFFCDVPFISLTLRDMNLFQPLLALTYGTFIFII